MMMGIILSFYFIFYISIKGITFRKYIAKTKIHDIETTKT